MIFDDFLKIYQTAFTNNIYSLKHLKDNFDFYKFKSQDDNVFLYDNEMLLYFVNDIKKYNLNKSYVKVIGKSSEILNKHDEFLKLNDFALVDEYIYMSFDNNKCLDKNDIFTSDFDVSMVIDFLKKYFKSYTLDINYLANKLTNKECLIYAKNGKIYGVLVFSLSLVGVLVDYIAVDKTCDIKNLAYLLLCKLCVNHKRKISLFVDTTNTHAIKFYKRFGFVRVQNMMMRFYKKD